MLTEFDVDIYLQPEREARVDQEKIPLWVKDYGFSQQGLSLLVEKRKKWYEEGHGKTTRLAKSARGRRCSTISPAVASAVVKEIKKGEMYYTMFRPDGDLPQASQRSRVERAELAWETTGKGAMRKLEEAMGNERSSR